MAAFDLQDALSFCAALARAPDRETCKRLFREIIAPFGFDTFACGEIDLDHRNRCAFYLIDWPDAWLRFYRTSGLIDRDPIVGELRNYRDPYTWSDLRADRRFAQLGGEALDRLRAAGYSEGLVVPLRRRGSRYGLISLVGHCRAIDDDLKSFLSLLAMHLHAHVRRHVSIWGCELPPGSLTAREIESVGLVAEGLSDRQIAQRLGIAISTAHEYVEQGKRKLGTRSRAETVAVAVSLGIIDV